ncbi:hypothetical protein A6302_04056 [Methylobrevis pamukkalensis]|uniref:Uncharacterized protein n=1 Tax=Methylobrevis pamukkalensis TaxID=1439726 RepID=A0A1E3GX63_9HYPH|nr:hypothetical protein A6302_04056 [Methylobrevis pamukkalensis]
MTGGNAPVTSTATVSGTPPSGSAGSGAPDRTGVVWTAGISVAGTSAWGTSAGLPDAIWGRSKWAGSMPSSLAREITPATSQAACVGLPSFVQTGAKPRSA